MKSKLLFFAFAFAAALLLAGCTAPGNNGGGDVHIVRMQNTQFHPAELTIPMGDTVRWVNQDSMRHDVNALDGSFKSGTNNMGPGATFEHTFDAPGIYEYRCTPHSSADGDMGMTGRIIVLEADGSEPIEGGDDGVDGNSTA